MNLLQKIAVKIFRNRGVGMEKLPHIKSATSLAGKRVLVRVDFNVPLGDDGVLEKNEAWRIEAALPTITFLQNAGAKVILLSHIGREKTDSLKVVAEYLNMQLDMNVGFVPQTTGELTKTMIDQLAHGAVILLENVRQDERETQNDYHFAEELAEMADLYVNDAFSASHRDHASIVGLPKFLPSYFGFQFMEEVKHLSLALSPESPLLAIIGGAKFETKIPLIKKFLKQADTLFVGGALAHTFFKYQGYEIGKSLFEEFPAVKKIMHAPNIQLPEEVVVETTKGDRHIVACDKVGSDEKIVDLGPESLKALAQKISQAQTIIWNGPLGWYEGGYEEGTRELLELVAESHAKSIIGGGDTVFVIRKYGMEKKFTFVSTAGGAMLDFLADGTLPGIEAVI